MSKSKLEYIWLDGYKPTSNLRSKTKVIDDFDGTLENCPGLLMDLLRNKHQEDLLIVC